MGPRGGPGPSALTEGIVGNGVCFMEKGEFNVGRVEFEVTTTLSVQSDCANEMVAPKTLTGTGCF